MFDIRVYGVKKRLPMIEKTVEKLGLDWDDVIFDDRENGGEAYYTFKKALLSPSNKDITHRVILTDDAQPCTNFKEIVSQIIETHPDVIVSLFPIEGFMDAVLKKHSDLGTKTPYIRNMFYEIGIGFIIPVKYIQPYIEHADDVCYSKNMYEDGALYDWARKNNIDIFNTKPVIVQHLGNESILFGSKAPLRVTKYYEENPVADWKTDYVIGK